VHINPGLSGKAATKSDDAHRPVADTQFRAPIAPPTIAPARHCGRSRTMPPAGKTFPIFPRTNRKVPEASIAMVRAIFSREAPGIWGLVVVV